VTLGLSGGERRSPGGFLHADLRVGDDSAGAAFLLGLADRAYTTLSGDGSSERLAARGRFAIRRPAGAAELRFSLGVGQPPFASAGYLPTAGSVAVSVQRERPLGAIGSLVARIEAERSVRIEPDAGRADSVDCSASLRACSKAFEGEAGVSADGFRADAWAHVAWSPTRSALEVSLDVGLSFEDGSSLLSAETRFRLARRHGAISLGASMEEWGASAGRLGFSLGWEAYSPGP
jgi:hypothetical protein